MSIKAISYSLWGKHPRYLRGMEANIVLARDIYPDWQTWIWIDQTVPDRFVTLLERQSDCRVIMQDSTQTDWSRLLWRFLTAEYPEVDTMIVRDADSRVSEREKRAVDAWLQAGTAFHVMRDHPSHTAPMLGGMWGCRTDALRNIRELIDDYYYAGRQNQSTFGIDQDFLAYAVWPVARADLTLHDSNLQGFAFPNGERNKDNYIGRVYELKQTDWSAATPTLADSVPEAELVTEYESALQQPKRLIVFYNKMYHELHDLDRFETANVRFSTDTSLLSYADAVVAHAPQSSFRDRYFTNKPPGQLWVSWSIESDANYPMINNRRFDLKMTYQRDADVWTPYFRHYGIKLLQDIVQPVPAKQPGCLVASFCSSVVDRSGRLEYLYELSQHIDVHHFGKYMRNRYLEDDKGSKTKLEVFKRYKFAFAFENSIAIDYVTEKFYDPLLTGTVPIYLGAPNIDEYAPGDDCYIDVRDFKDPADLAEYLKQLDADPRLMDKHLRWRTKPLRAAFDSVVRDMAARPHPFLQLAEQVLQRAPLAPEGVVPCRVESWSNQELNGEHYLVPSQKSHYGVALDATSLLMWRLIDGNRSVAEIESLLIAAYPSAAAQIKQDLRMTLLELQSNGAVRLESR